MTNIAQFINVLQAMILTDKDRMVLTPTYWVFDLYKPFQDATSLPVELKSPDYTFGDAKIPAVSATAARAKDGAVYVALANCDPKNAVVVDCALTGVTAHAVTGQVLTAETMNAHNTFEHPDAVKPAAFNGAQLSGGALKVSLPAKSVVVLQLK
jgi:alpha-N-arabinofuranosidase